MFMVYSTKINLRREFLFANLYFNLIYSFRAVQPFIQVYIGDNRPFHLCTALYSIAQLYMSLYGSTDQ